MKHVIQRGEFPGIRTRTPFAQMIKSVTVIGVLNNLLGYPHGQEPAWSSFISVAPVVVSTVLEKLIAQQHGQ